MAVRDLAGTDAVYLSTLGQLLRRQDESFSPERYGTPRLLDLIEQASDLGQVERRENGHPVFRFHPSVAAEPRAAAAGLRLHAPVWRAVTDFHPPAGGWHLDLATLHLVSSESDPERLLESSPERLLALPRADEAYQQALLRAFAAERGPEVVGAVDALLARDDWRKRVDEVLGEHRPAWDRHRTEHIVALVLRWADEHGIPRKAVARPSPSAARGEAGRRGSSGSMPASAAEVRASLHALIEQMSDAEVLSFPVPAWCLPRLGGRG